MASTARTHDDLLAVARTVNPSPDAARRSRLRSSRLRSPTLPPESGGYRYERKFRIDNVPVSAVEWWLRRHPAAFKPLHQPRWINNVYYDTLNLRAVWENLNGDSKRTKTRVRWYGDLTGPIDAPVLERKVRDGVVGTKHVFVLPPFDLAEAPDLEEVRAAIDIARLPDLVRLDIACMRPTLINRYRRRYYQSADRRYRATLDTDLEFYPAPGLSAIALRRHALPETIVMEMKYSPGDDLRAFSIGDHLPVRATRNSKYIVGMQLCYPIPDVQA